LTSSLQPFHLKENIMLTRRNNKKRKGAALVEYAILVAGIALIALAAVSVLGHKTTDMIAAMASLLPGAHAEDNGPIISAHLVETTDGSAGPIGVDAPTIAGAAGTSRLSTNLGSDITTLVVEPE
jgi:Flp pilus assembly pilin Flp